MRTQQRNITELEAYLSSPLSFSTFHTWFSLDPLHRAADLYFSTADANIGLPGWTKSTFRDYFVAASLEEQLAVHSILNLEKSNRAKQEREEQEESESFWISSEQVRRIEKWFNSTKVDEESFGKVLLQLCEGEIRTLLGRAEELEGKTVGGKVKRERRRAKKRSRAGKEAEDVLQRDMVRSKFERNKAKRRKTEDGSHSVVQEKLRSDIACDDSTVDCDPTSCSQLTLDTDPSILVDNSKDGVSFIASVQCNEKDRQVEQASDETLGVLEKDVTVSDVKAETLRSKRKRPRINYACDVASKRPRRKPQTTKAMTEAVDLHESLKSVEFTNEENDLKLKHLHVKEFPFETSLDSSKDVCIGLDIAVITKEESPITPESKKQSNILQVKEDSTSLTPTREQPTQTPRRQTRSQTKASTNLLQTPSKRSPTKSPFFLTPTSSNKRSPAGTTSCMPFPPLSSNKFGLAQESLATNPFQLLIAVQFLNKTKGSVAMPVFRDLMTTYPTPELLAAAKIEDIVPRIRHLGLQNQRASKIISLARKWLDTPPEKGKRYRTLNYPFLGAGKEIKPAEIVDDEDERPGAWEVAHLPGVGDYAIDSWRIFCRDVLRGVATGWLGQGASGNPHIKPDLDDQADQHPSNDSNNDGDPGNDHLDSTKPPNIPFEPEWKRVIPHDKELRAYLRWLWLKEGWLWNPLTGKRTPASEEILREAERGDLAWRVKEGGLVIVVGGAEDRVDVCGLEKEEGKGQEDERLAVGSDRERRIEEGESVEVQELGDTDGIIRGVEIQQNPTALGLTIASTSSSSSLL